jgi:hypothetical protein
MWVIELLVTLPSPHPEAPTHPFILKVLRTRERAPTPEPSTVFTLDSHLSLSKSLGACHNDTKKVIGIKNKQSRTKMGGGGEWMHLEFQIAEQHQLA